MNKQISTITSNPIGAVVGGLAAFYGAKKFASVSNKWALGAIAVAGIVAGAMVQAKVSAKVGAPNKATIKS